MLTAVVQWQGKLCRYRWHAVVPLSRRRKRICVSSHVATSSRLKVIKCGLVRLLPLDRRASNLKQCYCRMLLHNLLSLFLCIQYPFSQLHSPCVGRLYVTIIELHPVLVRSAQKVTLNPEWVEIIINKPRSFSQRATYTDRTTAVCRRS
jgi:hypothetical protein